MPRFGDHDDTPSAHHPLMAAVVRIVPSGLAHTLEIEEGEVRFSGDARRGALDVITLQMIHLVRPVAVSEAQARTLILERVEASWVVFVDATHPTSRMWSAQLGGDLERLAAMQNVAASLGVTHSHSANSATDVAYRTALVRDIGFAEDPDCEGFGAGTDFDMQLHLVADGWSVLRGGRLS